MRIPNKSKLLIVKSQNWLSLKLKSRFVASILLLYVPLLIIGFILQLILHYPVIAERGIQISLLWLAIAPLLIQDSLLFLNDFFVTHSHLLENQTIWFKVRDEYIAKLESRKFIVIEVVTSILVSIFVTLAIFYKAPLLIQIWSFVTYLILFYISFIGFRGILMTPKLIALLCRLKIKVDPFHPDCFGGIGTFGKLIIRGTLYFSTGALVLPLAFQMLGNFTRINNDMNYIIYILTSIFIGILMYSFISPILIIKRYIEKNKEQLVIESSKKLDELYKDSFKVNDTKQFPAELYFYNELYHQKILKIKTYPFNAEVLFELFISVFLPILIGIFEIVKFE